MNIAIPSKIETLRKRAELFSAVRSFFEKRSVLEVDIPILGKGAPIDAHIDVMSLTLQGGEKGFLHTSPEYAMKRLLSLGSSDIYQMSHVFRDGEIGRLHNPEFMMVEWYRLGFTLEEMIQETIDFIRLFLGDLPVETISYRKAIQKYAGIDYVAASAKELALAAKSRVLHLPEDAHLWDKDTLLQFLIGFVVEPNFQELTVLTDYPASQSALAKVRQEGDESVAERFEIYYKGVELANGFHELADAEEQRSRFEEENRRRKQMGKESYPLDERFLSALQEGFPDCCGVAAGFDRLFLLSQGKTSLEEVLPFSWDYI